MKRMTMITMLAASSYTGMALADDQGHNGDEAVEVSCQVVDASGKELKLNEFEQTGTNDFVVLSGKGATFSFRVELAAGGAKMSLTDTVSGDKVQVEEGDLDLNETVKVTLVTDESPSAALTLVCKGQ